MNTKHSLKSHSCITQNIHGFFGTLQSTQKGLLKFLFPEAKQRKRGLREGDSADQDLYPNARNLTLYRSHAWLSEKIFQFTKGQTETIVQSDGVTNNFRGKPVTLIAGLRNFHAAQSAISESN